MSLLLGKDEILLVNRRLAALIGLNEAIVLQQLHYWLRKKTGGVEHGGVRWIFNSLERWREQFPFWSVDTVKRALAALKSKGLIRVEKLAESTRDQTNYYTIDYAQIALMEAASAASCNGAICAAPSVQIAPMEGGKLPLPSGQDAPPSGADCTDGVVQIAPMTNKEQRLQQRLPKSIPAGGEPPPAPKVGAKGLTDEETELQAACRATWAAYSAAYVARYEAKPVRNAQVNAKVKQFVQRLGYEEAPAVAAFYVERVTDAFVVRECHPVGTLLQKAEGYRTQWAAGRAMTATRARQMDQSQANSDAADEAMAILRQRRGGVEGGAHA